MMFPRGKIQHLSHSEVSRSHQTYQRLGHREQEKYCPRTVVGNEQSDGGKYGKLRDVIIFYSFSIRSNFARRVFVKNRLLSPESATIDAILSWVELHNYLVLWKDVSAWELTRTRKKQNVRRELLYLTSFYSSFHVLVNYLSRCESIVEVIRSGWLCSFLI